MFRGDEYSLAKFFFEFSKGIGPLIRCIPIAEQLRTEGHEILYFGHKEAYKYMDNLKFNRINLEAKETVYTSVERKNSDCRRKRCGENDINQFGTEII